MPWFVKEVLDVGLSANDLKDGDVVTLAGRHDDFWIIINQCTKMVPRRDRAPLPHMAVNETPGHSIQYSSHCMFDRVLLDWRD